MLNIEIPELQNPGELLLWPNGTLGWDHPPLFLPQPLLLLRSHPSYGTRVETPQGQLVRESSDSSYTPLQWTEDILRSLHNQGGTTGKKPFRRPSFPLAATAFNYEYGRNFSPHTHCFPSHKSAPLDEVFISFHSCGFALKDNQWVLVGNKPSSRFHWYDWKIDEKTAHWPKNNRVSESNTPKNAAKSTPTTEAKIQCYVGFEAYKGMIETIQQHLAAGDIYQANLTVPFIGQTHQTPDELFRKGIELGGERYAAHFRTTQGSHISFSPELLLRRWGRRVVTKPIKGTRKAESTLNQSKQTHEAWSEKDRAEHVMIVDLERNDLGRLCHFGSVRVDPLMEVNTHGPIQHMESSVQGTLRTEESLKNLLRAVFPGGSVTGAPKKRALEILGKIEKSPRGIYCGALGWVDHYLDVELNLPIRTATFLPDGRFQLSAGGGIVADSTPESEWQELHDKLEFFASLLQLEIKPTIESQ
ncbi:MAG: chorismate-binding protein [Sumerlaeia bacterium]